MPETNGDLLESRSQSKKRRIPGACDICKRKKSDSGEMPDNRCSNCVQFGFECTHKEVTKTLGPAKGYVESLEARLEKMDRLLNKLLPGLDVNQEVDRMESPSLSPPEPELLPRNDDEPDLLTLQLRRLTLNPQEHRFFGKSSGYQLIQTAWDLKQEYTGQTKDVDKPYLPRKRREFWDVPPWITSHPEHVQESSSYVYPDEDLMPSLIDAFFVQINHFLPLLHRPTFEKSVAEHLHFSDPMFGATLLLVCAHGARYSDDPRVLADGSDSPRSAGWKWFEQVNVLRKTLFKRTTLYELQMHALHVSFGQSSETPQGIWAQIGLAVRLSQEVGAHRRRKASDALSSTEDELWKRAFWVLMTLDRHISASSGRPCGLQDEDFDLDLPLECDDEYWEHGFQQPPGKPSSIAFFNCYLRLLDIMSYAMRLIYPIKRPSNTFGRTILSEQQVIAELDSAMNNWMDSVPSHLRWNPNCDNPLFLKQSAALHAAYYNLQIFIHRPFIPSPRNPIPVAFPSLAICTNAARSCCHVLESFSKLSALPLTHIQNTAFTAALILLLNIWSGKRSGHAPNPKREMEDVQRCMEILRACERRWASAGRYRDILNELAFAGDVTIPTNQPTATLRKKRFREADDDPPTVSPPVSPTDQPRSMAGTRRVSLSLSPPTLHQIPQQQQALFSLPMYGNELGRLPIYGQFSFSDAIGPHSRVPIQMSAFDHTVLSNLASAPTGPGLPSNTDAYVVDSLFNGQTTESLANHNNSQQSTTSTDWASLFADNTFDFDGISQFGTLPAMDNDTMTMWSTAPRGLELDDWNTYISNVEQITQAQSQSNTHS
ncbi:fungal-specific transcription factor domain-containing protein [Flammula alnicola]|nr:fungal-specific transcription factor domain-containing protein [Flammula alnicola]